MFSSRAAVFAWHLSKNSVQKVYYYCDFPIPLNSDVICKRLTQANGNVVNRITVINPSSLFQNTGRNYKYTSEYRFVRGEQISAIQYV